jgi:hypothetical protein
MGFQADTGRQLGLDLIDGLHQAVDDLDGVLVLRFLHREQQRALAVVQRQGIDFLRAVGDAGHLVHAHGGGSLAGHDDLAEILGALHARVDLDHAFLRQRADRADRQVLVLVAHGRHHLVGRDAQRFHRGRVEVDVDLALGAAHQRDGADAAHVLEPLLEHLVGPVGQLDGCHAPCLRVVRHHGQRPDRPAGRVEAQHARLFHLGAETGPDRGDLFAHVLSCLAAVDVQLELDDDHRLTLVAARGEGVDAGDRS